ncbi:uncharacterized protein [Bombus fervidus]|uniref:uncharacterized protein n=1 Tax=Bombus fervidus TaxID=203811 RepID=UPI003AB2037A
MTSTNGAKHATNTNDSVNMVSTPLRMPEFWSHDVMLWFLILESHFEAARITSDRAKYHTTIVNLTERYVQLVRDILFDPPETRRYEYLKKELIKRVAVSDSTRVRKLLEGEQIGDRTPSQFYRDLKKLATVSTPDDFVVTLWRSRLPVYVQRVLDTTEETKAEILTLIADRVYEISDQIVAVSAKGTATDSEERKQ